MKAQRERDRKRERERERRKFSSILTGKLFQKKRLRTRVCVCVCVCACARVHECAWVRDWFAQRTPL